MFEFLKKAFRDMKKSAAAQHEVDKANFAAAKAEAKRLIIGHFSSRYKEHDTLCAECREIFPNTDIAAEGMTFNIEQQR